jgi:hypothetical protein
MEGSTRAALTPRSPVIRGNPHCAGPRRTLPLRKEIEKCQKEPADSASIFVSTRPCDDGYALLLFAFSALNVAHLARCASAIRSRPRTCGERGRPGKPGLARPRPPALFYRSRSRRLRSFGSGSLLAHCRDLLLAQKAHRGGAVPMSLPRCGPTCANRFRNAAATFRGDPALRPLAASKPGPPGPLCVGDPLARRFRHPAPCHTWPAARPSAG